jgi:sulfite reductase alpha subunit-like flavoprotein
LEDGVEQAMTDIGRQYGIDWVTLRQTMLTEGRYHAETY